MDIKSPTVATAIRNAIAKSGASDSDRLEQDARTLVMILATARSKETGQEEVAAEIYAAKVLCFIFDPVKARRTDYPIAMEQLRSSLLGVSKSFEMRSMFRNALTAEVLRAKSAGDAIELGAEKLFSFDRPEGMTL